MFLAGTTSLGVTSWARRLAGQFAGSAHESTRVDLAVLDRERILAAAGVALGRTSLPRRDTASEAFLQMTLDVPALAAAAYVDNDRTARYTAHAAGLLQGWFVEPVTRLVATPALTAYEPLLNTSALAEVAIALSFLRLGAELTNAVHGWFREYLSYLTTARTALLARDAKNHHGSSWMLQVAAFAKLLGDEATTADTRHRFKTSLLRAQINGDGFFPHELPSENPLRDSLFNLDLLAGVSVLLSTRFESVWDYELQDGPGMRAAVSRHLPYLRDRSTWPYRADRTHFKEMHGRRPVLAFAARAYAQPEYAALFTALSGDAQPTETDLLWAFPIRQPLLWTVQPRRT